MHELRDEDEVGKPCKFLKVRLRSFTIQIIHLPNPNPPLHLPNPRLHHLIPQLRLQVQVEGYNKRRSRGTNNLCLQYVLIELSYNLDLHCVDDITTQTVLEHNDAMCYLPNNFP